MWTHSISLHNANFGQFKAKQVLYLKFSKNLCFFGSCDFNFTFFAIFSKVRPFRSFVFYEIFVTSTTRFFFNCWVKYLRHYALIIIIFSVNLPVTFIYKFCRKENLIRPPPGEPRELNLLYSTMNVEIDMDSLSLFIN